MNNQTFSSINSKNLNITKEETPSVEELISISHKQGRTIIETIKIVKEFADLSLAQAKLLVTNHPAWNELVKNTSKFHEEIISNCTKDIKN
ncbi:MAG: hypothetical protein JNM06_04655 [Blastocatellia bacterium]|jgi:ribosomal protein L7/L12|nr:hypothetical protein [Blastocatellia bacterium]